MSSRVGDILDPPVEIISMRENSRTGKEMVEEFIEALGKLYMISERKNWRMTVNTSNFIIVIVILNFHF